MPPTEMPATNMDQRICLVSEMPSVSNAWRHLCKITLNGFKSYKNKTVISDLDPGFNVIVGRNGSGKSNLFAAIEFGLTTEFKALRPKERAELLYQCQSRPEPSYVEIIFDNTDRKLPVDSDTVKFTRVISTKKDKFICNGKELNPKKFLEAAGFSNPFFIVKQGKVHELATADDKYRLKLFNQVAGSTSFDAKINDFYKYIDTLKIKRREVKNTLKGLRERKTQLRQESSELDEITTLDNCRRGIELVLLNREESNFTKLLHRHERYREELNNKIQPTRINLTSLQAKISKLVDSLQVFESELIFDQEAQERLAKDIDNCIADKVRSENKQRDIIKKTKERNERRSSNNLQKLFQERENAVNLLPSLESSWKEIKQKESKLSKKLIQFEVRAKAMENMVLRGDSKAEYNKWSKEEVKTVNSTLARKNLKLQDLQNQLNVVQQQYNDAEAKEKESREILDELLSAKESQKQNLGNLELEIRSLKEDQGNLWNTLNEYEKMRNLLNIQLERTNDSLRKKLGRNVFEGFENMSKVVKDLESRGEEFTGYYGAVVENFTCNEEYNRAVEAGASGKLHHIIVEDVRIGIQLMKEFNRRKLQGTVNFIVKNAVQTNSTAYPNVEEITPLIDCLEYSNHLEDVMKFVFGKVLICTDFSHAAKAAKLYKMNCVTTEGDKVQKSGVMTGGYMGHSLDVMSHHLIKQKLTNELHQLQESKSESDAKLNDIEILLKEKTEAREKAFVKIQRLVQKTENLRSAIKLSQKSIQSLRQAKLSQQKAVDKFETEIYEMKSWLKAIKTDENEDCDRHDYLQRVRRDIKTQLEHKEAIVAELIEKESAINGVKDKINLINQCISEEENFISEQTNSESNHEQLEHAKFIVDSLKKKLSQLYKDKEALDEKISRAKTKVQSCQRKLEALDEEKNKLQAKVVRTERRLEAECVHVTDLQQRVDEVNEKRSKLGTVPSNAEDFEKQPSSVLYKDHKKLLQQLNSKPSVNRKAAEQLKELSECYDKAHNELQQTDGEVTEIWSLVRDLENRKDEAVLNNFNVLQEQFKEIFAAVVPQGEALVEFCRNENLNSSSLDLDSEASSSESSRRSEIQGIKISVRFTNQATMEQSLAQLSGGQKSVVALCLILALQRINPVPFYLFDEVDQALDIQYRANIAHVIHELASKSMQFICTTFRRELLQEANKYFGISYVNQTSKVREISREEAAEFVESSSGSSQSQSEEQASDEVALDTIDMGPGSSPEFSVSMSQNEVTAAPVEAPPVTATVTLL